MLVDVPIILIVIFSPILAYRKDIKGEFGCFFEGLYIL